MRVPTAAAVYARISDDTEGRAAGVQRQVEDASALASRLGWTMAPLAVHVDNDISASTRSSAPRPAFNRLIARVEAGEVDGIAYYSSSRLTRRPAEFETIISLVERTGVVLASVASGNADLTTADGRMIARILAAQDAAEAERIGERVKRAFEQRRREGKPNPSARAFGFKAGGLEVEPEEAELIREAAHRIADEGWSLGQVTRDWNERGIPTVRGADAWRTVQVRRALLSPRSAGLVSQHGVVEGSGAFSGIINQDLQLRVSTALSGRRKGLSVTYVQRKHLLAGFLACGLCGRMMKVNGLLSPDGSYRQDSYVLCPTSAHGCGRTKRNLLLLMEYIDGLIRMRLESWHPVGDAVLSEGDIAIAAELQRALGEIEEDLAQLEVMFKVGGIRFKDYGAALSALRTRQEGAQRALAEFQAPAPTLDDADILAAWIEGSLEDRREVLGILVDHIKLHPIGKVGPFRARAMIPDTTEVVWT